MRVLIAGCGYVGTELGLRLARAGHLVWGVRRSAGALPPPIRPIAADLLDPDLRAHLPVVDRVVYAAAADDGTPHAYQLTYVEGVGNLIEALAAKGEPVERFVFVSSTAVHGGRGGEWVDETTPPAPADFRGEVVLDGERRVRAGPFPSVTLRLGGIYGPGRGRLIERVRSGEARCAPGTPSWTNRIHRDDAAGALAHLLTVGRAEATYLGVDDEPSPVCDVYRFVASLLGVPPPPEGGRDARTAGPGKRCSNALLKRDGYRFEFPTYREGYRAIVARQP